MDLTKTILIELRDAIASRKISAMETTQTYLSRIDKHDSSIKAYHETYGDRALQRAAAVDAGTITGPLAGVPIALKDNMCTSYGRTTCSSRILAKFEAPYTATAVQRLEDAGAIILGKTNLDEFAMGSSTENSANGATRNPWDTDRVPGGSSGGSAAAMAADFCVGSLGSDTGGSIRQPAALCGVVGMKPTYGRISRWGLVAFASSLDQIGPFTHSVADAALLLDIMSGQDDRDATCAQKPATTTYAEVEKPVEKLRIGLAKQYMTDQNDPAVTAAVNAAVEIYRSLGAEVVEVDLPHTEYGIPTYYIVATAEASSNLARYDGIRYGHRAANSDDLLDVYARSRAEGFGPEVKRRIMLGTYALSSGYYDAYYLRALKVRRLIKNDLDAAFANVDAIVCPTTTHPAFRFGAKTDNPLAMYLNDIYTVNANLAGTPGISLPAGVTQVDGKTLPLAIQLLGNTFEEGKLLRIARMYEREAGHMSARPTLV